MDRITIAHFQAWLQSVDVSMRDEVEQAIHALLQDHPDLINTHSWPEMRHLAEQAYA